MIICAAIKDTRTGAVFGGIRHGNIYSAMHDASITPPKGAAIGGFLDEKNNFYDRMVLTEAQTKQLADFVSDKQVYNARDIEWLVERALMRGNKVVINADW